MRIGILHYCSTVIAVLVLPSLSPHTYSLHQGTPATELANAIILGQSGKIHELTTSDQSLAIQKVNRIRGQWLSKSIKPLQLAATPAGSYNVFKVLVDSVAPLRREDILEALHYCFAPHPPTFRNGSSVRVISSEVIELAQLEKVRFLFNRYPWLLSEREFAKPSTLLIAVRNGWHQVFEELVGKGVYLWLVRDEFGNSAMHFARSAEMIKVLAEKHLSPIDRNLDGATALHNVDASASVIVEVLRLGGSLTVVDKLGRTPLMGALESNSLEATLRLIDCGASLSYVSPLTNRSGCDFLFGRMHVLSKLHDRYGKEFLQRHFASKNGDGVSPAESWIIRYARQGKYRGSASDTASYMMSSVAWEVVLEELAFLRSHGIPLHADSGRVIDFYDYLSSRGLNEEATELRKAGIR